MSFSYGWRGPNIIKEGLVLYLDPGSPNSYYNKTSTTIKDISGNGNDGTLISSPIYNTSNGGIIVFDGVDEYINIPDNNSLDGFSSFSLNIWIYLNSSFSYNTFFHKWSSGNYAYFLGAWSDNLKITAGENYAVTTGGKTGNYGDVSNSSISINTWYNIGYVSTINTISLYINGTLDNTMSNSWRGGNIINSSTSLKLASHYDAPTYTNCKMSNVMVYNKALSAQEVLQNYNATKTRFGL